MQLMEKKMNRLALILLMLSQNATAGVWDTTTPAASDPISQGDDRIREMKTALQDALRGGALANEGDEAVFPGTAPATSPTFHYRGLRGTTAQLPAVGVGGLYYNTQTRMLQRSDGSWWENVGSSNPATMAVHQADSISLASSGGRVTLTEAGNAFHVSGTEDVTEILGWVSGVAVVRWTQARRLTHNGTALITLDASTRAVAAGDLSVFQFIGSGLVREIGRYSVYGQTTLPTRQIFTSGSGTYTVPVGARQIRVRMVAGGAGGGTNASATIVEAVNGTSTTFAGIAAGGGYPGTSAVGASVSLAGGNGGASGSGSASVRIGGAGGGSGTTSSGSSGYGGNSAFGGGGRGMDMTNLAGAAGVANSGGGGSGGNYSGFGGGGGGAGEYVEYVLAVSSAGSYGYSVGGGGAGAVRSGGGTGGPGGAGGSGIIIVEELY